MGCCSAVCTSLKEGQTIQLHVRSSPRFLASTSVFSSLFPFVPLQYLATLCPSPLCYPYHNRGIKSCIKLSYIADVQGMSRSGLNIACMNECFKKGKGSLKIPEAPCQFGSTDNSGGQETIKPEDLIPVADVPR